MPKVSSLGHVGLYVNDYPRMLDFYTRVLGLTVTDKHPAGVFLSSRPEAEHHEVVLMEGRDDSQGKLLQQLSFHVESVDEVRRFYQVFKDENVTIVSTVTHGNTASIYFLDPDGNRLEVYFTLPANWPQPFSKPIDLEQDADTILQQVHELTFGAAIS